MACPDEEQELAEAPAEEHLDVNRELEAGRPCFHCSGTGKVKSGTGRTVECYYCRGSGVNR